MSTFYIYPIEAHHHEELKTQISCLLDNNSNQNIKHLNSVTPLGPTSLSRILEIPIGLFDSKDMSIPKKTQISVDQQTKSISLSHSISSTDSQDKANYQDTNIYSQNPQFQNPSFDTVSTNSIPDSHVTTHSYANRRRSNVKRRKSVLSSSYIADNNDDEELDIIKSYREAALAALERGQSKKNCNNIEEELKELELKGIKQDHKISANADTEHLDYIKNYGPKNAILTFSRGFSNYSNYKKRGDNLEAEYVHKDDSIEDKTIYLAPQNKDDFIVFDATDSAIDLRTTLDLEQKQAENNPSPEKTTELTPQDRKAASYSPSSIVSPSTPYSNHTTPTKGSKKKVSSWSPRKIFHSDTTKKQTKKPAPVSKETTVPIKKQDRFTVSSLFKKSPTKIPPTPEPLPEITVARPSSKEFNHMRLPIHTERAIYRLSHMKLANTKRPLRDQVVISNLMFWYLSIIKDDPTPISNNSFIMTKKAYQMQLRQSRLHQNKRILRTQLKSGNSNAMDILNKQQKQQSPYLAYRTTGRKKTRQNSYVRTRNSSSEDEDEEDEVEDEEEDMNTIVPRGQQVNRLNKEQKKYSLFNKNNNKLTPLSKKNMLKEDEDDIPLAMYQRNKS